MSVPTYFGITTPTLNSNWTSNGLNTVRWTYANEGVQTVDMQLVRLTVDGVLPIAQAIPTTWGGFNVVLQDAPEGDDYFVLLLDSSGSTMYSLSQRFTISSTASPASSPVPSPVASVTVSGAPNPTMKFAATYGVSSASRASASKLSVTALCSLCVIGLALI